MPEKCLETCADLTRLEQQLKDLQKQNGEDHKELRDRIGKVELTNAVQNERYDAILGKLDALTARHDALNQKLGELEAKPGKRWESLIGYAMSALVGAFLLWLAAGMPGVKG